MLTGALIPTIRRLYLEACLKRFYISDASSLDCLLAQNEKRNTISPVAQMVGFGPGRSEMLCLSMGID
jgi:hypothetical protein